MGGYREKSQSGTMQYPLGNGGKVELTFPKGLSEQERAQWAVMMETYMSRFASAVGDGHTIRMPPYPQHEAPTARPRRKSVEKRTPQQHQGAGALGHRTADEEQKLDM
jgi:hypothetical protein